MPAVFLSCQPMVLELPMSWGLHCNLHSFIQWSLRPLCRGPNSNTDFVASVVYVVCMICQNDVLCVICIWYVIMVHVCSVWYIWCVCVYMCMCACVLCIVCVIYVYGFRGAYDVCNMYMTYQCVICSMYIICVVCWCMIVLEVVALSRSGICVCVSSQLPSGKQFFFFDSAWSWEATRLPSKYRG